MGGITNKAFIAAVIGGLGSLPGAVIGGVILGVLESLVSVYVSSTYRDVFSFSFLIVLLIFLPLGLLGKRLEEKV
jgi:branched-chain amino acid transport system permease protein